MPFCNLKKVSVSAPTDYKDTVTHIYQADIGLITTNPYQAMSIASSLAPNPLPSRNARLAGTTLFAAVTGDSSEVNRQVWDFTVTFSPPPDGENEQSVQVTNPLDRPPTFNIDYVEREYVIKKAKNVNALGFSFETGIREANTLAPIVNGAFRRPDEPLVDTERIAVITIERNYASLGEIMALNAEFQRTTNSDVVTLGETEVDPRQLRYLITRSQGRQFENEIEFYPGITEIAIEKTTDLIIDNVGWEYWDTTDGEYKRAREGFVDTGAETAEPINLKLDGTPLDPQGADPVTITYRHLAETAYSDFFA